jgi:arginase family enzyme
VNGALAAGLALAFASSVGLNVGYVLQHRTSVGAPSLSPRHPIAGLRALGRRPPWLAAIALCTCAWALYVAALWLAPLSLATAFLAGGLALVVPVARRLLHGEPSAVERTATVLMAVALASLVLGVGGSGAHRSYAPGALAAYAAALPALAVAVVALTGGESRCDALGFAAGAAYGLVDVCTKGLTGVVASQGAGAVFTSPLLYLFAAFTLLGFLAFQRGLQGPRPVPVIALMTATNYVVAMLGGLAVFGDPLGAGTGWAALHVAALVVIVALAFVLASGEARLFALESRPPVTGRAELSDAVHLDLDGAWPPAVMGLARVDLRALGPRLRYCARTADLDALRREAGATLHARFALLGSGDFHHLTALRLECLADRVVVVAFDNHPDWDVRPPRVGCGSWVARALELPQVELVVVWGCGNYELTLPSRLFRTRSRQLRVIGWEERYDGVPFELVSRANWVERFERFADGLRGRRVYVTVDLDALSAEEAATNWENGLFAAEELAWALNRLHDRAHVVGGDVCGACSDPHYARLGQRLLAALDHPDRDGRCAPAVNERALGRIWPTLAKGSRDERRRQCRPGSHSDPVRGRHVLWR